jgi:class 3 adenylate cyclase
MKSTGSSYSYLDSISRMDEILGEADNNYLEQNLLPARSSLTFKNGFYANCTAVFVDIRNSTALPSKYRRPALAKLYRAFISEMISVLDGSRDTHEVNIVGDGVWAVIDTPTTTKVSGVVETLGQLSSAIDILNKKLVARNFEAVRVGIGVDWGRALVVKAGLSGSGINDIVYMGDVVNAAAKLASKGEENAWTPRCMAGNGFVSNIGNETYRDFFKYNAETASYSSSVQNIAMQQWIDSH